MPYQHIIFVEGPDDQHAIFHLLKRHKVSVCLFDEEEDELVTRTIAVKPLDGYTNLRNNLLSEFNSSELLQAGIVVDANTFPSRRWQSLRDLLRQGGAQGIPDSLNQQGWVGTVRLPTGDIRTGTWILPNNRNRGALEEFARMLIPTEDDLWAYAETCIDGLPEKRFKNKDAGKALVHTWLAWQKEPGKPVGQAITKGFLDSQAPAAQNFIAWVQRLFSV